MEDLGSIESLKPAVYKEPQLQNENLWWTVPMKQYAWVQERKNSIIDIYGFLFVIILVLIGIIIIVNLFKSAPTDAPTLRYPAGLGYY